MQSHDFDNISNFTEQWWIEGTQITNQEDIALVKDILGKRKWATIYLYRNHPVFKYFCRVAVKKSWIRFLSLDFYKKLGK